VRRVAWGVDWQVRNHPRGKGLEALLCLFFFLGGPLALDELARRAAAPLPLVDGGIGGMR
jgi:hypothetical protein